MVDFKDFLICLLSFLLPNDRLNSASHVLVTHLCHLFTKLHSDVIELKQNLTS